MAWPVIPAFAAAVRAPTREIQPDPRLLLSSALFLLFARQEFMPTSDEEKLLLNFNGNKELLGNAEKVRDTAHEIKSFFCSVVHACRSVLWV